MAEPVTTTAAAASTGGAANWGAYSQAGAQAGTGILGFIGARQQRKHSTNLMKQAQAHDLSMWQMQAAYNSPEQQMQRLEAAGLNPNLIYGTGAQGATGVMGSRPETHIQGTEVPNELGQLVIPNVLEALSQNENFKQEVQHTERAWHESKTSRYEHGLKLFEYNYAGDEYEYRRYENYPEYKQWLRKKWDSELDSYQIRSMDKQMKTVELELSKNLKPLGLSVNDPVGFRMFIMLSQLLGLDLQNRIKNLKK